MNWDQVEGKWKQYKGQMKEKWGRLTDDDFDVINGKRQQLVGKIQEHYGIAREEAEKQTDEFVEGLRAADEQPPLSGKHVGLDTLDPPVLVTNPRLFSPCKPPDRAVRDPKNQTAPLPSRDVGLALPRWRYYTPPRGYLSGAYSLCRMARFAE